MPELVDATLQPYKIHSIDRQIISSIIYVAIIVYTITDQDSLPQLPFLNTVKRITLAGKILVIVHRFVKVFPSKHRQYIKM